MLLSHQTNPTQKAIEKGEERRDRAIVNATVRTGRSPLRPADWYGVPVAKE